MNILRRSHLPQFFRYERASDTVSSKQELEIESSHINTFLNFVFGMRFEDGNRVLLVDERKEISPDQ